MKKENIESECQTVQDLITFLSQCPANARATLEIARPSPSGSGSTVIKSQDTDDHHYKVCQLEVDCKTQINRDDTVLRGRVTSQYPLVTLRLPYSHRAWVDDSYNMKNLVGVVGIKNSDRIKTIIANSSLSPSAIIELGLLIQQAVNDAKIRTEEKLIAQTSDRIKSVLFNELETNG